MALQRIKGQEVEVLLVVDGVVQSTLTDVQSFEVMLDFETLQEGYLGEKSDRFDEVYKGVSGSMDLHNSSPDMWDFFEAVKDRAQRQSPGTVVNVKATLNYPSGERRRAIMQDVFFEGMGIAFGSRTEYGSTKLSFKGSEYRTL